MEKLYLDCDGVILDTINAGSKIIKEKNIKTEEEVRSFYQNLCWEKLINEAGEIDNSIAKIKDLMQSYDISILTHVISKSEEIAKKNYFQKVLPQIEVIPVPKEINKADYVNPINNILVDDFMPNLEYWYKKGGIPIKFSDSGKKCKYRSIKDLKELSKKDSGMIK